MTNAVAKEPMVRRCVSVQTDALETLANEISQLRDGLVGVLRPETQVETDDGVKTDTNEMPPLCEDIAAHTKRIEAMYVIVKDLNDRLEI